MPLTIAEDRPYPLSGLTTELWKRIPPTLVTYADLTTTQTGVLIAALLDLTHVSHCGDSFPHVVEWDGRRMVEDGHTRICRAILRGETAGLARVHVMA